ncbi:hypothetical protein TorRG33x02_035090, partial [Trema orientale]
MNYDCSVVVNGCVHWPLSYYENIGTNHSIYKFGIIAFDLNTEIFKLIKSPQPHVEGHYEQSI